MSANNKEIARINSIFFNLVGPIRDIDRVISFAEVATRLEDFYYEYNLVCKENDERYILLPCHEYYKVRIEPAVDENNAEINLTTWVEFPESMPDHNPQYNQGITGYYRYHAKFTLILDDWDPIREEEFDLPRTEQREPHVFGSVECTAVNFQEFIEYAIFKLSKKFETEIYPERISLKRLPK